VKFKFLEILKFSLSRKILLVFLFLLSILLIIYGDLIHYGLIQGYGQFKIIYQTQTVESVLKDPVFPDSLKRKLRLIQKIKQFAEDSLGINPSKSYTTFYNQ